MRAILQFLSLVSLAAAVVVGVADTVQSFAVDRPVLTPGLVIWEFVAPGSFESLRGRIDLLSYGPRLANALNLTVGLPAFVLFLALALIFWMLGYRKTKPAGRFAV